MVQDKKLIIGNWKMNLNMHEASLHLHKLSKLIKVNRDVDVILAPSMFTLQSLSLQIDSRQFKLAAQNFYWRDQGAFTGEISASQLRGIVKYALVGHSERRHVFHETDKDIREKVAAGIRNGIQPILCVGETAFERSNGETFDVLHDQLVGGLANITSEDLKQIVIAYEPVWAIGTGNDALPKDVDAAARSIRRQIEHLYGEKAAKTVKILYGGSVSQDNAAGYLGINGINGLLVGEISLNVEAFSEIVKIAHKKGLMATRKD